MFTVLPKNPEGRPPAVIDLLTVERAASIGCTVEDIAALLGLSRKTIYNHMEQDPELAEAMDRGRGMGRASLRRMQWEKAEAGSRHDADLAWQGIVWPEGHVGGCAHWTQQRTGAEPECERDGSNERSD